MYTEVDIKNIVDKQREYFKTNATLDIDFRIAQLKKLKNAVIKYEDKIKAALKYDLGRCETESYLLDIGPIILEINETIHGLKKWAKPETHFSGIACFPSVFTKVYKMPYGVTLIVAPFNFPFLLSLGVLNAAIAGGNTACLKLSSKSSKSTEVICNLIKETFDEEYICAIDGGHDVADYCLAQRFDKIFYTGSPKVAKHVMAMAAENLTPVALELGGETGNWAIVRKDANLKDAAKKIAFFKICNAGQICINVNQVAVAKEVADEFIKYLIEEINSQMPDELNNDEYPKLIAPSAYNYCAQEVEEYRDRVVFGGKGNSDAMKYETTILYPIDINESVVNHELFCPILPIVPFEDNKIDELINTINSREHGLALYLFTSNISWANKIMSTSQYGGGCINEVTMHLIVKGVPFGGTGHSGMGCYHGEWGFREFSHPTTVLKGSSKFDLPLRYHPYNGKANEYKQKLLKIFEK